MILVVTIVFTPFCDIYLLQYFGRETTILHGHVYLCFVSMVMYVSSDSNKTATSKLKYTNSTAVSIVFWKAHGVFIAADISVEDLTASCECY